MFLEHFLQARERLCKHGLKAELVMGAKVSASDIQAVDGDTAFPMPPELRQFYLELGDGFSFIPDKTKTSDLVGWEYMHLEDHRIWNKSFFSQLEEEALYELDSKSPPDTPELLKQELAKRKQWMPFYGFSGAGDVLCLDLNETPASVQFYELQVWPAVPHTWDFTLASSLTEFVERWGRYNFLSPSGAWTSFCTRGFSGKFDWAPEHFQKISDRQ